MSSLLKLTSTDVSHGNFQVHTHILTHTNTLSVNVWHRQDITSFYNYYWCLSVCVSDVDVSVSVSESVFYALCVQIWQRWEKESGICSVCETENTRLVLEQIEQLELVTGKPLERTKKFTVTTALGLYLAWRRLLFSTKEGPLVVKRPNGSCMSIAYTLIFHLQLARYVTYVNLLYL